MTETLSLHIISIRGDWRALYPAFRDANVENNFPRIDFLSQLGMIDKTPAKYAQTSS